MGDAVTCLILSFNLININPLTKVGTAYSVIAHQYWQVWYCDSYF